MHKQPSSNQIVYNTMSNNYSKQKHSKVLEGSQKRCENKIDFVCEFDGNSTELQGDSKHGDKGRMGCLKNKQN